MTRQRTVQSAPSRRVEGFPTRSVDGPYFRAARHAPWWFCRCGNCRFDLVDDASSPTGTLYAGTDPLTGIVEVIGPELIGGIVSIAFLQQRTVWEINYNRPLRLASLAHPRALSFGVTNELSTMVPYHVPQQWASAFHHAGFDGIHYRTRFSTTDTATGVALFDDAGEHVWPCAALCRADDQSVVAQLEGIGISVMRDVPLAEDFTFLE